MDYPIVTIKSGLYKGAKAQLYGTDVELFDKGVIALSRENSKEALDYVKRITTDLLPLMSKVYYAVIEGAGNVFVNESEFNNTSTSSAPGNKTKKTKSKGNKESKGNQHGKSKTNH